MNHRRSIPLILGAMAIAASPAFAQFSITWSTVDGGGGNVTGGAYSLTGSIGQPDASMALSGGGFSVAGGFWGVEAIFPRLIVEQPAGTNIANGGGRDFGPVEVGADASLVFTIKNTGNVNLTGLGITIDGADGGLFTVTTSPAAPVPGPVGSTTFTVKFAPTSGGAKTAALHIANNDPTSNPFNIDLSGTSGVLEVPGEVAAVFALDGTRPHPARRHGLNVAFSLPSSEESRLEMLDLSGRRVMTREVGRLGAGRHTVNLAEDRAVSPGIYWVRLTQGANQRSTRVVVLE